MASEFGFTPESINEFQKNLSKISDFTDEALKEAMEVCQGIVSNAAKANHPQNPDPKGKGYSSGGKFIVGHVSDRYYTITGKLTNSIRPGNIKITKDYIEAEINAGDSITNYAAAVEAMYPFMQPALDSKENEIMQILSDAVRKVSERQSI